LSLAGSCSLEEIANASAGPKMFQIIALKDRSLTRELILAAKALGYAALCLTVHASVRGKRERELRSGMGVPPKLSLASLAHFAVRPEWTLRMLCNERVSMANLPRTGGNAKGRGIFSDLIETSMFLGTQLDPSMSWDEVEELIALWQGPFAVKGIMHVEDARRAAAIGATTVIISNHGGRQLDGAAAPIEVLPRIVDAVGDRVEVILDGGIRRGVQVLKALARGAKACAIGRPYLYGLAAGGEAGVTRALDILRAELVAAMQLSGCTDVSKIDSSIVERI
jgi:L-lactate dehydrogenase (cytochrome)